MKKRGQYVLTLMLNSFILATFVCHKGRLKIHLANKQICYIIFYDLPDTNDYSQNLSFDRIELDSV